MFRSDTHLPQVLPPATYHDDSQFAVETARLLWPAWHCVASMADFRRDETWRSIDLLGVPLVVETSSCGASIRLDDSTPARRQRLRKLARTPAIRTGRVGQMFFVSLDRNGPSLEEHFGGELAYLEDLFSLRWAPCIARFRELPCNWKLLVENVLENYHLEEVHSATFKHYPPPEACDHDITDRGSTYVEVLPPDHSHLRDNGGLVARLMNVSPDPAYRHVAVYPNFTAGSMGLFNWAHCTLPVSPTRTINAYWFFQLAPKRRGIVASITSAGVRRWGRSFFSTLLDEDAAVLPDVQHGMQSPSRPTGGLISAREERIFHFQRHVLERTGAVPVHAGTATVG
jgi:choline monooxygenase